jgi:hypothetical protein
MPTQSPKKVAVKLQKIVDAWTTLRPTKSFAGMTLEQFKAKVQPSLAVRDQLVTLSSQTVDNRTQRQTSDDASIAQALLVVNAVKGDPDEGENGSLYATMGYVPKTARRSGLTRKSKTTTPVTQTVTASTAVPTTTVK